MTSTYQDIPPTLAETLRGAQRVVVFTGAGVSAESGIATFRDALTGLWSRFDAQALATPDAFRAHPDIVWGWYEWRRAQALRAEPNAAHRAIAALARHVPELTVVTQNVDDLHERAGSATPEASRAWWPAIRRPAMCEVKIASMKTATLSRLLSLIHI